jgi:hypothetical protein
MKLRLKEDPKEWRKNALLSAGGVVALSTVLRWRHIISTALWLGLLAGALAVALGATVAPRWFRGYYRVSHRVGFYLARAMGLIVLSLIFVFVVTPMGLLLRILGQDPLRLKRSNEGQTHWSPAGKNSPLDRLF